ncbi:Rv1733c family protein [Streptomyces sp. NPDC054770]
MRTPRLPAHRRPSGPPGKRARHGGDVGPGSLERPVDRLERRLKVLLAIVVLVAVPLVAWGVGNTVYNHFTLVRQTALARLHPVTATLLTEARSSADRPGAQSGFHALVRWNDRNGSHTGVAPVRAWLHRGADTTVWLDAHGAVATPPPDRDFAATAGVAMGCATVFGGVATACGVRWALGRSMDRRRLTQWARAWERVEPDWVTRYGR